MPPPRGQGEANRTAPAFVEMDGIKTARSDADLSFDAEFGVLRLAWQCQIQDRPGDDTATAALSYIANAEGPSWRDFHRTLRYPGCR